MIRFGTGGWRAIIADGFTKENIRLLTAGLCNLMLQEGHGGKEVCLGYDRRFLSKESAHWAAEVLTGYGFPVYLVSRSSPTPLIMFTVKQMSLPYGIAVTASHNPAIYNGIKIFGYAKGGDGHYVVNEADAALVRRVFSLYAQGNSVTTIENTLKAEGVLTANGVPFGHSRILYMITNEAYIGTYHFDGITIPGGLPAIIDRETWEVCQQLRQKTSRHYEKKPDTYIMSGKCTCGLCGGNVRGTSGIGRGHAYYYYICGTKRSKGTCNLPLLRKEFFEKKILDYLFDEVLAGELLDRFGDMIIETLKASRETSPISQMERSLHDIRRRIENINKAISEGIWTASTGEMLRDLTRQAEDMEKNISYHQLTEKKTISKDRVLFLLHKVADGNRADPEAVKTLIGVLVNSITVYEHWLRIVINAAENVEKIPPEDLPPLDVLPDLTRFDLQPSGSNQLVTVEPYPVIVFKIAI